jgi:hypothetical protein
MEFNSRGVQYMHATPHRSTIQTRSDPRLLIQEVKREDGKVRFDSLRNGDMFSARGFKLVKDGAFGHRINNRSGRYPFLSHELVQPE